MLLILLLLLLFAFAIWGGIAISPLVLFVMLAMVILAIAATRGGNPW